jgi:predicted MFS family arabinose efflux permease
MNFLSRRDAVVVFVAFAFAYFFSALIRAITATLSPTLVAEFSLSASDLGLLAGGYFLGFAATQLPLGAWLDRFGPRRVILCFLAVAVMGCLAFSIARNFTGLLAARVLCGVGVSACLMAPLTGYRRWYAPAALLRANSWMLMSGSLGMVASTLPVQWLMPLYGWRPLFWVLAAGVSFAMLMIVWKVPEWAQGEKNSAPLPQASYAQVWRHPYFRKMAPIGFFCYGGLLSVQTLWAAPWMTKVVGFSGVDAANGMFWINVGMLCTFWVWGLVTPKLAQRGLKPERLMAWGMPISFILLAILIVANNSIKTGAIVLLASYCMSCTFVSLAQPAVGMAFPSALAGRALSAYNLVIFSGVFVIQWGIGLLIDGLLTLGWSPLHAYQGAFTVFLVCCVGSYLHFVTAKSHNSTSL